MVIDSHGGNAGASIGVRPSLRTIQSMEVAGGGDDCDGWQLAEQGRYTGRQDRQNKSCSGVEWIGIWYWH